MKPDIKFLRRLPYTDYVNDQVIESSGGTVTDVPLVPDSAYEVEIEGQRIVLLGYKTKS